MHLSVCILALSQPLRESLRGAGPGIARRNTTFQALRRLPVAPPGVRWYVIGRYGADTANSGLPHRGWFQELRIQKDVERVLAVPCPRHVRTVGE